MTSFDATSLVLHDEVRQALVDRRGVVALESTIVVHGLPAPMNLEVARECEEEIRRTGATPATVAVRAGRIHVGLTSRELEELADPEHDSAKLSARDLGYAVAHGLDGATTVAGTIAVAHHVGISLMATGGLGGVHRGAAQSFDESADLTALSRIPVMVVASGAKSILDVGATLERLDTLGVPVWGYQTRRFPGFYLNDSGFELDWSIEGPVAAATAFAAHRALASTGVVLARPVGEGRELDHRLHDDALNSAMTVVSERHVVGKDVTPVLLEEFARFTAGASVRVNRDLVVANAHVAGLIAVEVARLS